VTFNKILSVNKTRSWSAVEWMALHERKVKSSDIACWNDKPSSQFCRVRLWRVRRTTFRWLRWCRSCTRMRWSVRSSRSTFADKSRTTTSLTGCYSATLTYIHTYIYSESSGQTQRLESEAWAAVNRCVFLAVLFPNFFNHCYMQDFSDVLLRCWSVTRREEGHLACIYLCCNTSSGFSEETHARFTTENKTRDVVLIVHHYVFWVSVLMCISDATELSWFTLQDAFLDWLM